MDFSQTDFADHPASHGHGVLRPLQFHRPAALATMLTPATYREFHLPWLPARRAHPLAAGRERQLRRANVDRHGGKFRHCDGWGAAPLHRGTAKWWFRVGSGGRRGFRRSPRAGDHRRSARQHTVPVTPAVHEQRGNSCGSRVRLLGGLRGDGLLSQRRE